MAAACGRGTSARMPIRATASASRYGSARLWGLRSAARSAARHAGGTPGQRDRWAFLVGEKPEIDAVAEQVGFRYAWDERTKQYAHPAVIFSISRSGEVTGYFHGIRPDPKQVRAALDGELPSTASSELASAVLNCFRFDTSSGRYGPLIAWLFKAGAASVGLALFLFLGRLMRHERAKHAGGPP